MHSCDSGYSVIKAEQSGEAEHNAGCMGPRAYRARHKEICHITADWVQERVCQDGVEMGSLHAAQQSMYPVATETGI